MLPRLVLLFGTLAVLSVSTPLHAQKWIGSIKIGTSVSSFNGDLASGNTDWDIRTGLAAGIAAGYDLGNGFIPQIEATYMRMGASTDVSLDGIPARIQSDLTYVQVPLLLQYRFNTSGHIHPRLFAGPMVAFQLDAHITFEGTESDIFQSEEDNSIESRDFGAVGGVALEIDVADQRLSLETRLTFGLSDITKPNPEGGDTSLKNQGIVFLVGFIF